MAEVPNSRYGRNNHHQQVQFYRSDIFGGDPELKTPLGRVAVNDIILRGFVFVEEAFSAGKLNVYLGDLKITSADIDLTATGKTELTIPVNSMWNVPSPVSDLLKGAGLEVDLTVIRDVAGDAGKGLVTVVIENIQPRISNQNALTESV